ncbi:MAG: response regulator [Thermodesulfobacteriota bacterium]
MSRKKILIVEDEIVVAMDLKVRLEFLGYDVVGICDQGEQVPEFVERVRPDLVLMDIVLAGKVDGIEAAQRLRDAYEVPVIFLTAHSDEATLMRATVSDPYGYLVKPFSEVALRTTIEVSLHNHGKQRRATRESEWFAKAAGFFDGAIILCDETGAVRRMNSLAEAITGWESKAAIGKAVPEVLILRHPQTGETLSRLAMAHQEEQSESGSIGAILLSADRSEIPVRVMPIPLTESPDKLVGALFLFKEDSGLPSAAKDDFAHAANLILTAQLSKLDGEHLLAEHCYQRALKLMERTLGPADWKVRNVAKDLAELYRTRGKSLDARIAAARAESIWGRESGTAPPSDPPVNGEKDSLPVNGA